MNQTVWILWSRHHHQRWVQSVRCVYHWACRGSDTNEQARLHRLHEAKLGGSYDPSGWGWWSTNSYWRLLFGVIGFIAAKRMEKKKSSVCLWDCRRDISSEKEAYDTIVRGIEKGKTMPIRDHSERTQKRCLSTMGTCPSSLLTTKTGDGLTTMLRVRSRSWVGHWWRGVRQVLPLQKEFVIINGHSNVARPTAFTWSQTQPSILIEVDNLFLREQNHIRKEDDHGVCNGCQARHELWSA